VTKTIPPELQQQAIAQIRAHIHAHPHHDVEDGRIDDLALRTFGRTIEHIIQFHNKNAPVPLPPDARSAQEIDAESKRLVDLANQILASELADHQATIVRDLMIAGVSQPTAERIAQIVVE